MGKYFDDTGNCLMDSNGLAIAAAVSCQCLITLPVSFFILFYF